MFKKKREEAALKEIRAVIDWWQHENPTFMVIGALAEIKKDKNLLEYYFPEVDWSKVDKDSIYNNLFADSENLKQGSKQTGRRKK